MLALKSSLEQNLVLYNNFNYRGDNQHVLQRHLHIQQWQAPNDNYLADTIKLIFKNAMEYCTHSFDSVLQMDHIFLTFPIMY